MDLDVVVQDIYDLWECSKLINGGQRMEFGGQRPDGLQYIFLESQSQKIPTCILHQPPPSSIIKCPKHCFVTILNKAFCSVTHTPPLRHSLFHPIVNLIQIQRGKLLTKFQSLKSPTGKWLSH